MATKNFQFFVRPAEVTGLLNDLVAKYGLWLIFYAGGQKPKLVVPGSAKASVGMMERGFERVYLSSNEPMISGIDANDFAPARLGWLEFNLPKEDGMTLYLAELAVKSDWFDSDANEIKRDQQLERLYGKIRNALRKELVSPLWAKNIKSQGVSCYKDMAYSKAVADWEKQGHELRQQGVNNVKFSTDEL